MDPIDKELADAQARVEFLLAVKLVRDNPEGVRLVMESVESKVRIPAKRDVAPDPVTVNKVPVMLPGKTAIERLASWFESRRNAPATVLEMSAASGVGVSAIRQAMARNADMFVDSGKIGREKRFVFKRLQMGDLQ